MGANIFMSGVSVGTTGLAMRRSPRFPGPKRYTCSIPRERPAAAHTIERVRQVSIPLFLGKLENKYRCQEMEEVEEAERVERAAKRLVNKVKVRDLPPLKNR